MLFSATGVSSLARPFSAELRMPGHTRFVMMYRLTIPMTELKLKHTLAGPAAIRQPALPEQSASNSRR